MKYARLDCLLTQQLFRSDAGFRPFAIGFDSAFLFVSVRASACVCASQRVHASALRFNLGILDLESHTTISPFHRSFTNVCRAAMESRRELSLDDAAAAIGLSTEELRRRLVSLLGGFCPSTVSDALSCLKAKRAAIPSYTMGEVRDGRFEDVDGVLIPLLELDRSVPISPLSAMEPITISARAFDVLITDIKEEDFSTIGTAGRDAAFPRSY